MPDPYPRLQVEVVVKAPRPPKGMGKVARKEWKRIVKLLQPSKVLTELDSAALFVYATTYERYTDALEDIKAHGYYKEVGDKGYQQQRAAVGIAQQAAKQLLACCIKLGLTPTTRKASVTEPIGRGAELLT